MNSYSHFSRYRCSRDRSSIVEDQEVSQEFVYDTTPVTQVAVFYQNWSWTKSTETPRMAGLVWYVHWINSGSTPTNTRLRDDEPSEQFTDRQGKVSNLWDGLFRTVLWFCILERKFARPHVIIDAKQESIRKASQVKPHNSTGHISFSVIVSQYEIVLKEYKQIGDLQSSSPLYMAVDKLPQVHKEKLWFYV